MELSWLAQSCHEYDHIQKYSGYIIVCGDMTRTYSSCRLWHRKRLFHFFVCMSHIHGTPLSRWIRISRLTWDVLINVGS